METSFAFSSAFSSAIASEMPTSLQYNSNDISVSGNARHMKQFYAILWRDCFFGVLISLCVPNLKRLFTR